jgi:hypothetical protein
MCGFLVSNVLVGDMIYRSSRSAFFGFRRSMRWTRAHVVEPPRKALRKGIEWLSHTLDVPPAEGSVPPADGPETPPVPPDEPHR